jgi:hypothetical protein
MMNVIRAVLNWLMPPPNVRVPLCEHCNDVGYVQEAPDAAIQHCVCNPPPLDEKIIFFGNPRSENDIYHSVFMGDDPPHACVDGLHELKVGDYPAFTVGCTDAASPVRMAKADLERRWWAVKDQFYSEETWHMDAQGNVTFHHKSPNERPAWVQDFIDKHMPGFK